MDGQYRLELEPPSRPRPTTQALYRENPNMSTDTTTDVAQTIAQSVAAGISARFFHGIENYQYQMSSQRAAELLAERGQKWKVIQWNRLSGFFVDAPSMFPDPVLNKPENAWNLMVHSQAEIDLATAANKLPKVNHLNLPFKPEDHVIFVIHEIDAILQALGQGNHALITWIRSYISTNMGTPRAPGLEEPHRRGGRMLVFLGVNQDLSKYLPELTPIAVELPDETASERAMEISLKQQWEAYHLDDTTGLAPFNAQQRTMLINSLAGMPYQDREEAISVALIRSRHLIDPQTRRITDFPSLLACIEDEKARYCRAISGVEYKPKLGLPTSSLPGYEAVDEYVERTIHIDAAWARRHNLPPSRGILLVGPPGTGKTEMAKAVARKAGRMLLSVNLGEIQGSLVGQSEANMKKVLSIIKAMKPVVFIDEIDKLGVSSIESGHQGDGGTYSRVIAAMLGAMTDPENEAIWILAANRLVSTEGKVLLPAALIRPGRLDERFYVDLPDAPIRRAIIEVQLERYCVKADVPRNLDVLAEQTENFVGAELADIVIKATRLAGAGAMDNVDRADVVDTAWMLDYARRTAPLASQEAFKAELEANRRACERFTKVRRSRGVVPAHTLEAAAEPGVARTGRKLALNSGK